MTIYVVGKLDWDAWDDPYCVGLKAFTTKAAAEEFASAYARRERRPMPDVMTVELEPQAVSE